VIQARTVSMMGLVITPPQSAITPRNGTRPAAGAGAASGKGWSGREVSWGSGTLPIVSVPG
jgi:hypothetical protein